jgi:hypothetical protein
MNNDFSLVGKSFGRLTVLSLNGSRNHTRYWLCSCVCGKQISVITASLHNGNTKSCGCLHREYLNAFGTNATTHKMWSTRFYRLWSYMRTRATNKRTDRAKSYVLRGITLNKKWLKFENFRDDMLKSYQEACKTFKKASLERINVNGNYTKQNCRWIELSDQASNRRDTKRLTYKNETKTLKQWSKESKISYWTLRGRFDAGWPANKMFKTPQ